MCTWRLVGGEGRTNGEGKTQYGVIDLARGAQNFATLANASTMRYNDVHYCLAGVVARHDDRGERDGHFFESGKCGL